MLTALEVSKILSVSLSWVYRHKNALGGFQPSPGSAVRFSENHIGKIKEGEYAIPDEKREMARQAHDFRQSQNKNIQHKTRGQKMGSLPRGRDMGEGRKLKDPYGLLA